MSIDFDTLPPVTETPSPVSPDDTPSPDASGPICVVCDRVIVREPGKRGRVPKYHPECRPSNKSKATGTRRKPKGTPDYREGIAGLLQMGAFALGLAAGDHNPALLADSAAIANATPDIATALDALAQEKPEIAAVLDKVLAVGPYGVVLSTIFAPVIQIASNHGAKIPGVPNATEYLAMQREAA